MAENGKIEELTQSLKVYVQTNIELVKLEATERVSVLGSSLLSVLLVGMTLSLFILFLSIGVSLYLSAYLNNSYLGFILVAGFYFLLSCLLVLTRKKLIETPIRNTIIKRILRN